MVWQSLLPGFFFYIETIQKSETPTPSNHPLNAEQRKTDERSDVPESVANNPAITPLTTSNPPSVNNTPQEKDLSPVEVSPPDDVAPSPSHSRESEKVQLAKGETLRILAEKLFGNREFWVYIYLENRESISDPNRVPAGISLHIPDRQHYSINAADSASVSRAKELGDKIIDP